jgi:ABC-type phosphate/phosphonate transport system substrate-binding protein
MDLIACSRMYDVGPSAREAWHVAFARLAEMSGVALRPELHAAPAPLEDLWARADMGCVFMCGWPWTMAQPRPVALAAPALSVFGGRAVYRTDFVVRREAPYRSLADTFGGRLGWTVHHSHSGCNAPRHHLLRYGAAFPYAQAVGPLISAAASAAAVRDGLCDVGPLDAYSHALMRHHVPEMVSELRVLESTDEAPVPLLVASPGVPAGDVERLRAGLLSLHRDPVAREALGRVLVERFVAVDEALYDAVLPAWAAEAEAAGMRLPPDRLAA